MPSSRQSEERREAFRRIVPFFGKIIPSIKLRSPGDDLPGVKTIHPLIEGIYKPADSLYAFSIASMLKSPYADQTFFNPDGSWWLWYSPKDGGLNIAANASLMRCMQEREPVLVLKQIGDKTSKGGARHRVLGLGFIDEFSASQNAFQIRGLNDAQLQSYLHVGLDTEDVLEAALRLQSLEAWSPFIQEERAIYHVSRIKRDAAFRQVVLDNYDHTCAVTGQKFIYEHRVFEADAAHIIAKGKLGSDDPRNGIALSKSVHWAFDQGVFTISDQFEVLIHPKAKQAASQNFLLLDAHGRQIVLPSDTAYHPHSDALEWHRKEMFGRFAA
jgi:HNH endonuclease